MADHDSQIQTYPRPQLTFFDLSRELRDQCYILALTTREPLVAWSGIQPYNSESGYAECHFDKELYSAKQFKIATSDERATAISLFRCNQTIANEAATIFYGKNNFLFAADWNWETVATWFHGIGLKNRTFVTSIELWQYPPAHAWQLANGERIKVNEFSHYPLEPPFPRNRLLDRAPGSISEGLVETINPAIETFFELVGKGRPKTLQISIILRNKAIPGLEIEFDQDDRAHEYWFTMDLPNLIEKLRTMHTAGGVDVIWKGERFKPMFLEAREGIEAHWEIVGVEDYDFKRNNRPGTKSFPWVRFTLRVKEVPKLLLAHEASSHWHWGSYSIRDDLALMHFHVA
ncbi:hypothetical protein ONS95_011998 [Cadophora gregata]|uniref:uncharacterized protein n=1 Tax=Cadophora gregata TaxID=51156 RepID=UPI0026DBF87D|nr:uncharacterized protein ONS95_011998 [Cadophora gregata]KAK0117669.1 hypothetical protein ONS95_011998 [Cadophora gregata]KAK0122718.1 hypothetical protein ONS96_009752 [Cadophora gregata f. sp. sojae]